MRVEIKNETGEPHARLGTKLLINGVEIPELANVEFKHAAGNSAVVRVDLFAHGDFKIELDAEVYVSIIALPGEDLLCVPSSGPGQPARYYTAPAKLAPVGPETAL